MNFNVRKWLPTRSNRLALEALLELAYARILRVSLRFSRLSRLFGKPESESPAAVDSDHQTVAREIGLAIVRASRRAPFQCNCMTQAICALRMLKRRRISYTLYLGVTRGSDVSREAHAWTRCGPVIVTGETELNRYDAVFRFANQ